MPGRNNATILLVLAGPCSRKCRCENSQRLSPLGKCLSENSEFLSPPGKCRSENSECLPPPGKCHCENSQRLSPTGKCHYENSECLQPTSKGHSKNSDSLPPCSDVASGLLPWPETCPLSAASSLVPSPFRGLNHSAEVDCRICSFHCEKRTSKCGCGYARGKIRVESRVRSDGTHGAEGRRRSRLRRRPCTKFDLLLRRRRFVY